MSSFPYKTLSARPATLGLVVLQSDETIECDFRRLLPNAVELFVSRVPSGLRVSSETLAEMESHLTAAASLFPRGRTLDAVGFGCTSGAAEIGPDRIADQVRAGVPARRVTEPVSALVAACRDLKIRKLAFLSPYVQSVSERLRIALAEHGVETPVFGTFAEPEEAKVARIDATSLRNAATALAVGSDVDAIFLSCTNLKTLDVIEPLERAVGLPVLSSNQVLAWHMLSLANSPAAHEPPGQLFRGAVSD